MSPCVAYLVRFVRPALTPGAFEGSGPALGFVSFQRWCEGRPLSHTDAEC